MRVEHDGTYAAVASKGGAPEHPTWYYNFVANPLVELQDGTEKADYTARIVSGDERAQWWSRAAAGVAGLRRVPEEDRPRDPGLRARAGRLVARRLRTSPECPSSPSARVAGWNCSSGLDELRAMNTNSALRHHCIPGVAGGDDRHP